MGEEQGQVGDTDVDDVLFLAKDKVGVSIKDDVVAAIAAAAIRGQPMVAGREGNLLSFTPEQVAFLEWLCSDKEISNRIHHNGIEIAYASFPVLLDLARKTVHRPLRLRCCALLKGIGLDHARTATIDLTGSSFFALKADDIVVEGDLILDKGSLVADPDNDEAALTWPISLVKAEISSRLSFCNFDGRKQAAFRLVNVMIGDDLDGRQATLINRGHTTILLESSEVKRDIQFEGLKCEGEISFRGTTILGGVRLDGAKIENPNDRAIFADHMDCKRGFKMRSVPSQLGPVAGSVTGQISMRGAKIGGTFDISGASVVRQGGFALRASGLRVGRHVRMRNTIVKGATRLRRSRVGGDFDCRGCTLVNPRRSGIEMDPERDFSAERDAIDASLTTIGGNAFFAFGFTSEGSVRLKGARIGSDLICTNGTIRMQEDGQMALSAAAIRVSGHVFLDHQEGESEEKTGFRAVGGIRLRGARIGGMLIASGGKIENPGGFAILAIRMTTGGTVLLDQGFTATGRVSLVEARVGAYLFMNGARIENKGKRALDANGIRVAGRAEFGSGFSSVGAVDLRGARINGDLEFEGAHISKAYEGGAGDPGALLIGNAEVTGDFLLDAAVRGRTVLRNTSIGGECRFANTFLDNSEFRVSLLASTLTVGGDLFIGPNFRSEGEVRFNQAKIGGRLLVIECYCKRPQGALGGGLGALAMDGLQTGGTVHFGAPMIEGGAESRRCRFMGVVRARSADIGGQVLLHNLEVSCESGDAINLIGASTGGSVQFDLNSKVFGPIRLRNMKIGANLDLFGLCVRDQLRSTAAEPGAVIDWDYDYALDVRHANIAGEIRIGADTESLTEFKAFGQVAFSGASVGSRFRCEKACFCNPGGISLNMDRLIASSSLRLGDSFRSYGQVTLSNASIGGDADFAMAQFDLGHTAINGDDCGRAYSGTASASLQVHEQSKPAVSSSLSGKNRMGTGSASGGVDQPTLDGSGLTVKGRLRWKEIALFEGCLSFVNARVGALDDDKRSWEAPNEVLLHGFSYAVLTREAMDAFTKEDRRKWLSEREESRSIQPFEQLSLVFRRMGFEADARAMLLEKQKRVYSYNNPPGDTWPAKTLRKFAYYFYGKAAEYGYGSQRIFLTMVGIMAIWAALYGYAGHSNDIYPLQVRQYAVMDEFREYWPRRRECNEISTVTVQNTEKIDQELLRVCSVDPLVNYPVFHPIVYSIDVFVPFLDLHQERYWEFDKSSEYYGYYVLALWVEITLGWIFSSLLIASLTGLARRE